MRASAVSSGLSSYIPQLLLADFRGKKNLFDLAHPVMEGVQTVNGVSCFAISGTSRANQKVKIWISEQDFLIRKIETDKAVNTDKTNKLADSLLSRKFLSDSASLQKRVDVETNFQRKASLLNQLDSLRKQRNKFLALRNISRQTSDNKVFSVKSVYLYHPYKMSVPDKNLFLFRPDREVPL